MAQQNRSLIYQRLLSGEPLTMADLMPERQSSIISPVGGAARTGPAEPLNYRQRSIGREPSGFGNATSSERQTRVADQVRRGFSDNPRGILDALGNMAGLAGPMGAVATGVGSMIDVARGHTTGKYGLKEVRGYRTYDEAVHAAVRNKTITDVAGMDKMQREIDARREAHRAAMNEDKSLGHAGGRGPSSGRSSSGRSSREGRGY